VLRQLRHDPRTIAPLLVVPVVLETLLRLVYDGKPAIFDRIGAPLLDIFPLITMFLVTSIATLRERTSGTLERLLTMPLAKLDLLLGYALAFGAFAVLQVAIATGVALTVLGLDVAGPAWLILVLAVANAVLGTALGLFVSAFAASEFQAVQFMPAVILPQLLLCGLLLPREQMQTVLRWVSDVLPLSYAVDAMSPGNDHDRGAERRAGRPRHRARLHRRGLGAGCRDPAPPHGLRPGLGHGRRSARRFPAARGLDAATPLQGAGRHAVGASPTSASARRHATWVPSQSHRPTTPPSSSRTTCGPPMT
jgi:ABC-2 type transport system permease protein